MDIKRNELWVLKEDRLGDLKWHRVNFVNLGSLKEPNEEIKQVKIIT